MKKNRRAQPHLQVAIEVSSRDLSLVIVEQKEGQPPSVRGHHVAWGDHSQLLDNPDGTRELTAVLSNLVTREKLPGATVRLALSSDFCVTRVLAGTAEKMQGELRSLRDRCNHYLWLGAGAKAQAESSRETDAKHLQAWLTVTSEVALQSVIRSVQMAGLKIDLVEHSMVAACRALGSSGHDKECPAIIVELNQRGVDLGVCYQGLLLFDYRPGGTDSKEHLAEIVERHLDRIQRYCDRHFRFARGHISHVFLWGNPGEVADIRQQFAGSRRLSAEVMDLRAIYPDGEYDDEFTADARYVACFGSALASDAQLQLPAETRGIPNLMDHFRRAYREPLVPALVRLAWPVAATVLLSLGIFAVSLYENSHAIAVETRRETMEAEQVRQLEVKRQIEEAVGKTGHLRRIQSRGMNPAWHELISMIGHCLPQGTWLESVRVDDLGTVAVTGTGSTEDQVYEFVRYLKEVPVLANVSLEAQRAVRAVSGPAVSFDIKCDFVDHANSVERAKSND